MKQEKRHKLQLHYEILCAIEEDVMQNDKVRPTRIQHSSRLSYDKMMNHFDELEGKRMIYRDRGLISITSKGRKFTKQYNELINLIESVGLL
ncbi:MAG TPA: winged helix-turn-helix domain-containing protein [Candidatus Nitrosopolaris rasttigaisensis]|nr:winged helix-turn-helix domain-containing protein [Candidatus Nitrosopolaris rasttigaisensis]